MSDDGKEKVMRFSLSVWRLLIILACNCWDHWDQSQGNISFPTKLVLILIQVICRISTNNNVILPRDYLPTIRVVDACGSHHDHEQLSLVHWSSRKLSNFLQFQIISRPFEEKLFSLKIFGWINGFRNCLQSALVFKELCLAGDERRRRVELWQFSTDYLPCCTEPRSDLTPQSSRYRCGHTVTLINSLWLLTTNCRRFSLILQCALSGSDQEFGVVTTGGMLSDI